MSRKTTKKKFRQLVKGKRKLKFTNLFNPYLPSAANMRRSAKILILILEGIIKKKIPMSVATMSR